MGFFFSGLLFDAGNTWRPMVGLWHSLTRGAEPTACSIYSQLPSKTGERLLHPQPEDAPCRGDKGPT
jgi:hypothetical protein